MTYIETYSEARIPHRKIFSSEENAISDINKYIKFSNVSISVFKYMRTEKKYKGFGDTRKFIRIGPDYSSAITNKLFFDIDCMNKDGVLERKKYDGMVKLWEWAQKHDYKREIAFTGGGYQVFIWADVRPEQYSDAVKQTAEMLGVEIDPVVSTAMLRRVVGSYNFGKNSKSVRNCFCIDLKDDEPFLPFHAHVKMAQTQRKERFIYGDNVYKPKIKFNKKHLRRLEHRTDFNADSTVDEILDKYGWCYDDFCDSMKALIEQPHVSHHQRIYIIEFLKDIVCMSFADVMLLLPKLLTAPHGNENDGEHSITEGQPYYVYSNNKHFIPRILKSEGYCDENCYFCENFIKFKRSIE